MPESGRSDDSFAISVESLVSSLNVKLKNAHLSMPPSPCIFKTPSILYRHKEYAFLPNRFSIGPMHHGRENLAAGEKIKINYLNGLLSRVTTSRWPETRSDEQAKEIKQQEILTELVNAVQSIEKNASACYAERDCAAELEDKFLEVMMLDGCFLIELFLKGAREVKRETNDPIFSVSSMLQFLHHDLILLENQIPWLVLQTLFEKTKLPSQTMSLIELTLFFFDTTFLSYPTPEKVELVSGEDIKHILDLLRLSIVLPSQLEIKNAGGYREQSIPSVSRLQEAGVKIMKVDPEKVLDIRFENGALEIPSLLIQETTETSLRNLIAYEQCLPNCRPFCTCYAKLLDNLIDTPNDIDILCKNGIFDNWMSPEDATQFFNKLHNDTYVQEFYYRKLCRDVNEHCKRCWPKWRAYYVHNYYAKPWAVAAQIYAVIIFVFTLWQTYIKKG